MTGTATIADVEAAGYTAEQALTLPGGKLVYAIRGPGVPLLYLAQDDFAAMLALVDPAAVAARIAQEGGA